MTWKAQVPTYDQLTLPLLQLTSDGEVHSMQDALLKIAGLIGLTEEQINEGATSGKRSRFEERLAWAKTYLIQAGLLRRVGWGEFQITQSGVRVLAEKPSVINRRYLMQFPSFRNIYQSNSPEVVQPNWAFFDVEPRELMQLAYTGLQLDLANDLLEVIMQSSPTFFERLVIDLLLAMGYGDSRKSTAKAIGRSGDGGIDGIIQQDRLGLETIYIQAKRWEKAVGRPDIQAFVGSLIGVGGKKGIFITTSRFTHGAIDYAEGVTDTKVILIDGARLTHLMMEYEIGVTIERVYTIGAINRDYFDLTE
jgi:restriction system protein